MTLKLQLDHLLLQYILHLTGNKTISNRDDNLANRNQPVFITSQGSILDPCSSEGIRV